MWQTGSGFSHSPPPELSPTPLVFPEAPQGEERWEARDGSRDDGDRRHHAGMLGFLGMQTHLGGWMCPESQFSG